MEMNFGFYKIRKRYHEKKLNLGNLWNTANPRFHIYLSYEIERIKKYINENISM